MATISYNILVAKTATKIQMKRSADMGGVNLELLSEKINASGLKKQYIAEEMGITRFGLDNKLKGKNRFYSNEICIIAKLINLSRDDVMNIFFVDLVGKTATKTRKRETLCQSSN